MKGYTMAENSMKDIMDYLGAPSSEFREFWQSLTEDEKLEYKATELP